MRTTNHGCPRMYFVMAHFVFEKTCFLDQIWLSTLIKKPPRGNVEALYTGTLREIETA